MKIVLLEKIEKLGKMGDVVSVKDGFGRNYLLPRRKALRATKENIAYFEKERADLEAKSKDLETKAGSVAKKIEKTSLIIVRQSSESGNLYGSVSPRDITKALAEKDIQILHTQVKIDTPIKTIGVHDVKVLLHPEVSAFVKISIAPSEEEAKNLLVAAKEEEKSSEQEASEEKTSAKKAETSKE